MVIELSFTINFPMFWEYKNVNKNDFNSLSDVFLQINS